MRYPASEKLEIIQLIEQSNLSVRRTFNQLGIPKSTSHRRLPERTCKHLLSRTSSDIRPGREDFVI